MNVKELIAKLQKLDPKAEVCFAYPYGDRTRSYIAAEVDDETKTVVLLK